MIFKKELNKFEIRKGSISIFGSEPIRLVVSSVSLSSVSATSQEWNNGGEDEQERSDEGQNEAVASGGDARFGVGEDSDPPEPAQKNEDEGEEVHASTQQAAHQRRTAAVSSLGGSTDNVRDDTE